MGDARIVIEFDDLEHLRAEHDQNFVDGGAFARGATGVDEGQDCEVILVHPASAAHLSLPARAVWVVTDPGCAGIGVAFLGFDDGTRRRLDDFVGPRDDCDSSTTSDADDGDRAFRRRTAGNVHQRLRGLSVAEQHRIARDGEVSERIVLERLYGKTVWEPLLRNPRLTLPEVARIARMGSCPRPLLELIVANGAWLQAPQIRRALLGNPRLSAELITRILRLTPRHELKLMPSQTAYPAAVREQARRLLQ